MRNGFVLGALLLVVPAVSPAQEKETSPAAVNFKILVTFDGSNGAGPFGNLVQGIDGNLYGVTNLGGANSFGDVFSMTPHGSLSVIHRFCGQFECTDGSVGNSLALGKDGNFYGTTTEGGLGGPLGLDGIVFKISPSGAFTTLYDFCSLPNCADGAGPLGLVQGSDGNFYGTNGFGGDGSGTAFKMTPEGALTTLHTFCSEPNCTDGTRPGGPVIQATDGNFYGTTYSTAFKLTPQGDLTTLYTFCSLPNCADGSGPSGPLVQAPDGNFYGTTEAGGAYGGGTVFEITPSGTLNTLYNFCAQANCADGKLPGAGGLVLAADGNFYGATNLGGINTDCTGGCGTLFKVTPRGVLTTLHSFEGAASVAAANWLMQDTSGSFYGQSGGNGYGTVFALSAGLGPFIRTLPNIGEVGETIKILGTDLTSATAVAFNGKAAAFRVISPSLIHAVVPAGATTGPVTVTTSSLALESNVKFQVRP